MQVVIERIPGGYRAKPWTDSVEGTTPEQETGARFIDVPLTADDAEAAWGNFAGWLKDDPDYDALQNSIEERRRQFDEDTNAF